MGFNLVACYFLGFLFSMLSFVAQADIHVLYNFQPVYDSLRPYFKIELNFNSGEREEYILNLPSSDSKNINIRSIEPKASLFIENKAFPAYPTLKVPKNTPIKIHYELYDKGIHPDRFLLHGTNLFIVPGAHYAKIADPISITLNWPLNSTAFIANSYAPFYSPLNQTQSFNTTLGDLDDAIFIGGNYQYVHVNNPPNGFLMAYDLPQSSVQPYFDGIKKIVRHQKSQLEEKLNDKNLVIFKENKDLPEGEVAASKWLNVILLQANLSTYEKYPERVLAAFSHEHMHIWFSERLSSADKIYPRWFFEGFNDYFSLKAVHALNLISTQYYLDYLNGFILCNHFSPGAFIPSDKIEEDYEKSPLLFFQPYARGHLFAIELDYLLRTHSGNKINLTVLFKDYFKYINNLKGEKSHKNKFSIRALDSLIYQKMGASFAAQYLALKQKHIINGEAITLSSKALWPLFDYSEVDAADNDFSFDFYKTITSGVITGVQKNSLAYKNGLRNHQKLISYDYDLNARFNPLNLVLEVKANQKISVSVPIQKIEKKIHLFKLKSGF